MSSYFGTILQSAKTVLGGLGITMRHLKSATNQRDFTNIAEDSNYFKQPDGLVTLQYPSEAIPTPSFSRYRLHNDAADCIACNQCANVCPVQCITIESFKATPDDMAELGLTSDGSKKKLWLEVFDIDMAKCMFCGYCTYPCPTECITMTPVHDFSEFDRSNFLYHFGALTKAKAAEKRAKLAKYEAEEKAKKAAAPAAPKPAAARAPLAAKAAPVKAEGDAAVAEAKTDAPKAEAPATDAPKAAPKLSPMMAARLAAKKGDGAAAPAEAKADVAPEAKTDAPQSAATASGGDGGEKPKPKLSPALQARLAAKKAAEGGDGKSE